MLRMLIMGCPGSGKGTLAKRVTETFNLTTLSSGDVFRRHVNELTETGLQIKSIINKGELVNDDLAVRVVFEELKKFSKENWLLDGFPRTLGQAKKLDESLNEVNHPLDLVLNLDVPEDIILKRIVDRYIHPASGRTYNLNFNPPRRHGFDDLTGEKLVKREDDDIKIVKKRIRTYHLSTEPLLDYYRQKGVLKNFVGKTSAEIFPKLEKVLIDYNSKILIYYDKTQKAAGKPTILT